VLCVEEVCIYMHTDIYMYMSMCMLRNCILLMLGVDAGTLSSYDPYMKIT
jgi:hypothetical protein